MAVCSSTGPDRGSAGAPGAVTAVGLQAGAGRRVLDERADHDRSGGRGGRAGDADFAELPAGLPRLFLGAADDGDERGGRAGGGQRGRKVDSRGFQQPVDGGDVDAGVLRDPLHDLCERGRGAAGVDGIAEVGEGGEQLAQLLHRPFDQWWNLDAVGAQGVGEQQSGSGLCGDQADAWAWIGREPYSAEGCDGVYEVAFVVDEDGSGLAQGRPCHAPGSGQGAGVGAGEVTDVAAAHDQGHDRDTIGQAAYGLGEAASFRGGLHVQGDGPYVVVLGNVVEDVRLGDVQAVAQPDPEAQTDAGLGQGEGQRVVHASAGGHDRHRARFQIGHARDEAGRQPSVGSEEA